MEYWQVISLGIVAVSAAVGYGVLVHRVTANEEDLDEVKKTCEKNRTQCHVDLCRKIDMLTRRIDDFEARREDACKDWQRQFDEIHADMRSFAVSLGRIEERIQRQDRKEG